MRAQTAWIGMFFWPGKNPGSVPTSKSVMDSRCSVAKLRTLACTVAMSSITWAGTWASLLAWGLGNSVGFPVSMSAGADKPRRAAAARVRVVASIGYLAFLAGPPLIGFSAIKQVSFVRCSSSRSP